MVQNNGSNNFGCAKLIVDPVAGQGNYTTIATALTAASSGDTIFIRPGTYTENLTLKAGVNLSAYNCDAFNGNVTISGKATFTAAGTVDISGIRLQTNSDFCLAVTGSAASVVHLNNCYLNCTNNTGISFTSSDATSVIRMQDCRGDLGTTGIGLYSMSSAGSLISLWSSFSNTGSSTTASSNSAGLVTMIYSQLSFALSTSSTGVIATNTSIVNTQVINTTCITTAGSGANNAAVNALLLSGSASAVSIGSGTTMTINNTDISSSNTNAITGAGTLSYSGITFSGSSFKINTTTQTGGVIQGGVVQAPSTGFIGETLTANASSVATSNGVPKTITSLSVTPGYWLIGAMAAGTATGGTAIAQAHAMSVSTTDNTQAGSVGIGRFQISQAAMGLCSSVIPMTPTLVTTTTTFYVVVTNVYSSTTCPTNAQIYAVRIG